ncbi:hypothetical protein GCM10020001_003920 [Nonomuraea salmonea]
MQANGRSARVAWAPSSSVVSRETVEVVRSPSSTVVSSVVAPGGAESSLCGGGRRRVGVEQLDVHPLGGHAQLGEHRPGLLDHLQRPAEPHVVEHLDRDERGEQAAQPVAVEPS